VRYRQAIGAGDPASSLREIKKNLDFASFRLQAFGSWSSLPAAVSPSNGTVINNV
jgi:hypothetical protein